MVLTTGFHTTNSQAVHPSSIANLPQQKSIQQSFDFLRHLKPFLLLSYLHILSNSVDAYSLRGSATASRSLQNIETVTLPKSYSCRIQNFQSYPVNISDSALCQNSTFEQAVGIQNRAQFVDSISEGDCEVGENARVYRSFFGRNVKIQSESVVSDLYVAGDTFLGEQVNNTRHCDDKTGVSGVHLTPVKKPWEVQGNLHISQGISLELIQPLLENVSRIFVDGTDFLRVIPGNITFNFDENCTMVSVEGPKITAETKIVPMNPRFQEIDTDLNNVTISNSNMNITGSIPSWGITRRRSKH